MKNKEVVDKLSKYFIEKCDPKVVARILAAVMIDFNRIANLESLSEKEKVNLFTRIKLNNHQLKEFILNDSPESIEALRYSYMNSDEG